jgi:hypothetical protein
MKRSLQPLKAFDFKDIRLYNKLIVWSRYYILVDTFGGKFWQQE